MEYTLGDKVVNSQNLKMGNVVEVNIQEDKIKLQYNDGLSEWVHTDSAKNLLIDDEGFSDHQLFIQD